MGKRVDLTINGDFHRGFAVNLKIRQENGKDIAGDPGKLPPYPELREHYNHWQALYRELDEVLKTLPLRRNAITTNSSDALPACQKAADLLKEKLQWWLGSAEFSPIEKTFYKELSREEEIWVLLETDNPKLLRFPWHLWGLLADFPKTEIVTVSPSFRAVKKTSAAKGKVRIMAILGDEVADADVEALKRVPDCEVKWLRQPQPEDLDAPLWEEKWDILFFAGHSWSLDGDSKGEIRLSEEVLFSISDLRNHLQKAIGQGLQLAIFNSCDGLGLAHQLAAGEDLHLPCAIVMRENLPKQVAPKFLRYFLEEFTGGKSLYAAVGEARKRLQGLEKDFPCASWLPVICQNPAVVPPTWQELLYGNLNLRRHISFSALTASICTALVMGMQSLGIFQAWELQAYDQRMQLRPDEGPDNRLLVVTVTEADFKYQDEMEMMRQWSLSDAALEQLLVKLVPHQPRAIGLDIYRDFPADPDYKVLASQLGWNNKFLAVCKANNPNPTIKDPGVSPPPEVPKNRLGFSNIVFDSDGVLRRYLWYATFNTNSPCPTERSFSLQLALRYLAAEGIQPKPTPEGDLQLGEVRLKRLKSPAGPYPNFDDSGYQMLLNYRTREDIAQTVTVTEVLKGEFDPSLVKDRVVLIGVTASSIKDDFKTPFSRTENQTMRGVFLHGQMVSQILSAVLDGRILLRVLPPWWDAAWVWGWAFVGGLLAWRCRRGSYLVMTGIGVVGVLYGVCFFIFIQGYWVPLVPSAFALLATELIVVYNLEGRLRQSIAWKSLATFPSR